MRLIITFLLLCLTSSVLSGQPDVKKIKIVFRFDDYMMIQDVTFDSIINVFKKNNIPLTLGVVPYGKNELIFNKLNQDQLNDLKDRVKNNEIEIALHGFTHTDNKLTGSPPLKRKILSEFSNLEYNKQVKKIRKGKQALDSILNINTVVFIPPYNSYDANTIEALDRLNFKVISASMDGYSVPAKISYIPYTIDDLTELPELLKTVPDDNYSIIAVIHPYSFFGEPETAFTKPVYFSKLDTLLNWINQQDNILAVSFSALAESEEFSAFRYKMNSTDNNMLDKTLEKLKVFNYNVYNTTDYQMIHKRIWGMLNIVFHIIIFIIFYLTGIIFRRLIKPHKVINLICILLFSLFIIAVLYKAINSHALVIYILFLTTIVVAFCAGLFKLRGRVYQWTGF